MEKFLDILKNLQNLYKQLLMLNLETLVQDCSNEEYEKEKLRIIEDMKMIAIILTKEYKLKEFDFFDDESFLVSVKKFLSKK